MSSSASRKGYDAEIRALRELGVVFPRLRRQGSVGYYKAAADLIQDAAPPYDVNPPEPIVIVATQDLRRPMLFTMDAGDVVRVSALSSEQLAAHPVVVQVKKREKTWLGTIYGELAKAVGI